MINVKFFIHCGPYEDLWLATREMPFVPPIGATIVNLKSNKTDFIVQDVTIDFDSDSVKVYVKEKKTIKG